MVAIPEKDSAAQEEYTCLVCGTKFNDFDELQGHYEEHQKGK